jgi:hypothetical protein
VVAAFRLARPAAAALIAAALGASAGGACNRQVRPAPLPAAGAAGDDGTGQLARSSVRFLTASDEGGFEPRPMAGGYVPGYETGAVHTYGGFGLDGYGGFGGSIYAGYQPAIPQQIARTPGYLVSRPTEHGAIAGRVTWPRPPAVAGELPGCGGGPIGNPSVRLGAGKTVEGAVVYLEAITRGRVVPLQGMRPVTLGGTLAVRDCAFTPHVQILGPVPGALAIAGDGAPRAVIVERPGDPTTSVERRLEAAGVRSVGVTAPGVLRVGEAGGAVLPAWVVAAAHPYYAMTDARGRFRLDDVPAGDYTLVVWHPPPLTVVAGQVEQGKPVVVTRRVTVKPTATTTIELGLP